MSATAANLLPAPSISKTDSQKPLHLELCILGIHLSLYSQPPDIITSDADAHSASTAGPPNSTSPSAFTCLLSGPLDEFLRFSRQEQSRWLINIAHDFCDPAQKRGSLQVWDVAGMVWKHVNPTDPLTASLYLYDVQTAIDITKISKRTGKSKTDVTSNPSTMAGRVRRRDQGQCWVTGKYGSVLNSHVCPKRMGDHQFRIIYKDFVSDPPSDLSVDDELCGITLAREPDGYFDVYELGLRQVGPDQYECHFFGDETRQEEYVHLYGRVQGPPPSVRLHGLRISPPQPKHERNPPPGLIRWHYLQCVIRRFVHSDYKNMKHIDYYELPLRMEGDSDDEGTDSEFEWPSAPFDRGRAVQAAMKQDEERQRSVAEWAIGVL